MLADTVVEIIEGLMATKSHNRKLADLIYDALNKMADKGLNKIVMDTNDYDLTITKDRNTGLDTDNIHILISPR